MFTVDLAVDGSTNAQPWTSSWNDATLSPVERLRWWWWWWSWWLLVTRRSADGATRQLKISLS